MSSSSSSSSSVYQGLQSCLMEPRVLSLKLSPPGSNNLPITDSPLDTDVKEKQPFTNNIIATCTISNDELDMKSDKDCWSFIQSLPNISNKTDEPEAENVYVHPTIKCSSSMLSAKSLEMCTENLGCETGSNASDSSDEMSSLFSSEISRSSSSFIGEINTNNSNYVSKRLNRGNNFPPPLTSLTDFGGVRVRPRREDGRLILEAVTSSSPQPYFQAKRSNGRLRLRFYESVVDEVNYDDEDDDNETDYDAEEEKEEEEDEEEEEEACDDEEEEEESGAEEELEMTKFARPSRCKESGSRVIFGDTYFELPSISLCL